MRLLLQSILLSTALSFMANTQAASNTITSMDSFEKDIDAYVKENPNDKILVVFDIDDTLLESAEFFGGDAWYNWSRGKPMSDENGNEIRIEEHDKMQCLFSKLGVMFDLARHHPTEKGISDIVARLQKSHDVMALTSRSPDYRGGTERELAAAKIDFSSSHLLPETHGRAYKFAAGGSSERKVSYVNGIVMSSGLNKGVILDDLLKNRLDAAREYDAIFFVDDGLNNVDNMNNHWADRDTSVFSYLYQGVDKSISKEDVDQARAARSEFNEFIEAAFKSRFDEFAKGSCN